MKSIFRMIFRIIVCMVTIQGINMILGNMNIEIFVGMNGYTLVLSAILGLPGILGLYIIGYFF